MEEVTCRFDESKYVLKIYNDCYGGGPPLLSDEAKAYRDSMIGSKSECLLRTLEKFGCKGATKMYRGHSFSCYGVCLCPIECANFFTVDEYDGLETPHIDHPAYLFHLINQHYLVHPTLSKDEFVALSDKSNAVELIILEID